MIALLALLLASVTQAGETRSLYLQLIHQARADGRPRAAIAYLDDFDRRYPGDGEARILRINSLLDLGDISAAEAAATHLPPDAAAIRGHLLAARGHWAAAVPFYRQAIAASPADPLLRNALGYALLRAGSPAEAAEALRAALDLAPVDRTIRNNLLLALSLGGQRAEAETIFRQIRDGAGQEALRRQIAAETARLSQKGS